MSDESEVEKVLGRAVDLRKAMGKPWTALILLFALWTVRKRAGLWATITSIVALLIAGWLKMA